MSSTRSDCPVLTCSRDMPAGQVMCSYCWGKVPKDLRRSIGASRSPNAQLVSQAISAAQAAP